MKHAAAATQDTLISAAEFKAKCLQLIDDAHAGHQGVVITKRGVPMARLVPYEQPAKPFLSIVGRTPGIKLPPNFAELRAALSLDWADPAEKLKRVSHAGKRKKKKR